MIFGLIGLLRVVLLAILGKFGDWRLRSGFLSTLICCCFGWFELDACGLVLGGLCCLFAFGLIVVEFLGFE